MAEKMSEAFARNAKNPKFIRNICTSAHIHHGKTAMTDNLIAAAGLMASKYAGDLEEGMVTWQHKDEQERLLTVDAAMPSLMAPKPRSQFYLEFLEVLWTLLSKSAFLGTATPFLKNPAMNNKKYRNYLKVWWKD